MIQCTQVACFFGVFLLFAKFVRGKLNKPRFVDMVDIVASEKSDWTAFRDHGHIIAGGEPDEACR